VPAEWQVIGRNPLRGPYAAEEAKALQRWGEARHSEYGQALHFILSSGARIEETLHLRADKILVESTSNEHRDFRRLRHGMSWRCGSVITRIGRT